MTALLQRPDGERLIQALAGAPENPARSILTSVQRGIILVVTCVGMLLVAFFTPKAPAVVPGIATVVIFVGIGLLVAALVSYRISKRWRLLEQNDGSVDRALVR